MFKLDIQMTKRDGLTFAGQIKPPLLWLLVSLPIISAALPWLPALAARTRGHG